MRPHPRYAEVETTSPRAWGTCQNCGFTWNLYKLKYNREWRGLEIMSTGILVCPNCQDVPQRQLGAVILPPDPIGVLNARPEPYTNDEETFRIEADGELRYEDDGTVRVQGNLQD